MKSINSTFKPIILILLIASFSIPALSCEGQEKEQALGLIYEALYSGYQAGITGNFQYAWDKTIEISNRAKQLSPSCQQFINEKVELFTPDYTPNETLCKGSTCCDGTSCYSN